MITKEINNNNVKNSNNDISNNESKDEIHFYFSLSVGCFQVKGKLNDKFQDVLDKFIQKEELFNFNQIVPLYNGNYIQKEKTLAENNIKEDSIICIMTMENEETPTPGNTLTPENDTPTGDSDFIDKEKELKENEDDSYMIDNLYEIREYQKLLYESIRLNKSTKIKDNENEKNTQIVIKRHNHGLVYLFSNSSWICNICKTSNSENIPKYYCSLCDYNECNNCIGNNKKFPLTQKCHEQTKLKSFKFPFHEHKLVYCRTSREKDKLINWSCDICDKLYSNKIWSFYCTFCDYDLCLNCSKHYYSSDELITNYGIKTDEHNHILVFMISNRKWECKLCLKKFDNNEPTYYCTQCEYNICQNCMSIISDEQKYPFFSDGERLDDNIETVNIKCHNHPLIYCKTSRTRIPTAWNCNICTKSYGIESWSFYCSLCDFDICLECYIDLIEK